MNLSELAWIASKLNAGLSTVGLDDPPPYVEIAIMVSRDDFNLLAAQMDGYHCRPGPLRELRVNGFLILPKDAPRA